MSQESENISSKCQMKNCEDEARRLGICFSLSDGAEVKSIFDASMCARHGGVMTVDKLLGVNGWAFVCDHFKSIGLSGPVKNRCRVYLLES